MHTSKDSMWRKILRILQNFLRTKQGPTYDRVSHLPRPVSPALIIRSRARPCGVRPRHKVLDAAAARRVATRTRRGSRVGGGCARVRILSVGGGEMSFCRWPHASASPALSKWTARQSDTTTVLSHAYEHYAAAAPVSKEIAKPFSFVFFLFPSRFVSICVRGIVLCPNLTATPSLTDWLTDWLVKHGMGTRCFYLSLVGLSGML